MRLRTIYELLETHLDIRTFVNAGRKPTATEISRKISTGRPVTLNERNGDFTTIDLTGRRVATAVSYVKWKRLKYQLLMVPFSRTIFFNTDDRFFGDFALLEMEGKSSGWGESSETRGGQS